ncbi:MAG: helix-turn-helix domain-containing protein [Acetobacteraceae bacterium]|nr:helix-turn-helix domain-containing protein [Acetobacteraceae bacterium]
MFKTVEPGSPSEADMKAAQEASRALARLSGKGCVRVDAESDHEARQSFILPATAVRLLTDVLAYLAEGRTVLIMPEEAELTTQQAADMLNVSRPYLVKMLAEGKLPYHKAGTHRRVLLRDLQAYRQRLAAEASAALDELTQQAQELDMGY